MIELGDNKRLIRRKVHIIMASKKWSAEEIAEYRKKTNPIFYFNREDSNIFVPKPYGFGRTLNFANPVSWAFIAAMIAFLIWVSRF